MLQKVLLLVCSIALTSAGNVGYDYSPPTSVSYSTVSPSNEVNAIGSPYVEKFAAPIEYTKIIQAPPVYESILTTKESKFKTPDGTQHSSSSKSLNTGYSRITNVESKSFNDGDILANAIPDIYPNSVHTPIFYHPHPDFTYSSNFAHSIGSPVLSKSSVPVAYSTHNVPLTKTIISPATTYYTPVVSKTKVLTSGLSSYASPHTVKIVSTPTYTKSVSLPITYTSHSVPLGKTIYSPTYTPYSSSVLSKSKVISPSLSSYSSHTPVIVSQPIKTTLTYSEAPIVSHMSFSGLGTSYAW